MIVVTSYTDDSSYRNAREATLDFLIDTFGPVVHKTRVALKEGSLEWNDMLDSITPLCDLKNSKAREIAKYQWAHACVWIVGSYEVIEVLNASSILISSRPRNFIVADINDEMLSVQYKLAIS